MKKKPSGRRLFVILMLGLLVLQARAQLPATNLAKYWFYRNRLDYFVIPGEKRGESQIACTRNKLFEEESTKNLDYGQHGIYTGFYWGVLATEYALLKSYGQEEAAANTAQELYLGLRAYVEDMDMCENFWGKNPAYDGYFIRVNIPCNFFHPTAPEGHTMLGESHVSLLNKRLTPLNQYNMQTLSFDGLPRGHPAYANYRTSCDPDHPIGGTPMGPPDHTHPEPMSQDETIGLLTGLALTIKLTDGTACKPLAEDIADKLVRYILNLDEINGATDFRIYEPDGSVIEESRGGNTYYLAKGIIMAGEAMTGQNDYGGVDFVQNSVWSVNSWWAWDCSLSKMAAMLAAIGDSWTWTDEGLMNITAHYNWDTFYLLLWEVLHNKTMNPSEQQNLLIKTMDQLNNGPCEGTYCYASRYDHSGHESGTAEVHSGGGWGSTYKWCKEQIYQDGGDWWLANYNGLDFMILYNLWHIVQQGRAGVPVYINYKDLVLSGHLPYCYPQPTNNEIFFPTTTYDIYGTEDIPAFLTGFNSITSTQIIDTQTMPVVQAGRGTVEYKAEMKITLKPGFHAIRGCHFLAYLDDIDCESGEYRMRGSYPEAVVQNAPTTGPFKEPDSYFLQANTGNYNTDYLLEETDENASPLFVCSPNPFTTTVELTYSHWPENDPLLSITNSLGVEVYREVIKNYAAGIQKHQLQLENLPCGTYYFTLSSANFHISRILSKI